MKNDLKKFLSLLLVLLLIVTLVPTTASAAIKISKTKATLDAGKTITLKVNGTTKTVKWTSSKKDVATVTSKGKVKAISSGTSTITATVGTSKYKCAITVKSQGYEEGSYKVGKDIPAGEYVLFSNSKYGSYFSVNSDSSGKLESIIFNDNFDYNSIITIEDGTYLEMTRCYAVPLKGTKIDTSGSGVFKVGTHLDAGEYKIISTSDYGTYVSVTTDSTHSMDSIVSNDNFANTKYVTVEDGQYLTVVRGKIAK